MKRTPEALTEGTFDLLILGGGITGSGVALDATLRGFRTALIDKGDIAGGTSSESSKLVHGGLRYLEHGAFSLVYEALHERRRLLHNAPHLVRPLRFIIPFYEGTRLPPWQWRLGLTLYDLLAGRGNLQRSRGLRRADLRRRFPGLRRQGLHSGAAYFDARMDDARVCIEVLQSAVRHGACAANYIEALGFEEPAGRIAAVRAVDHITGQELTIRARVVLNATGPWVDAVCRLAGDKSGPYLRPTKGVHLVTANPGLTSAFLLLHPTDGRVFFVIPWLNQPDPQEPEISRGSVLLIGTTDTISDDRPEALTATPADIGYLLAGYNHHFAPPLAEGDLLSSFAGLRPLIRARPGEPSSLTREFRIFRSASGLLSVAGGKFTTYRHMAEVVTDAVAEQLGRRRLCRTKDFLLDGAPDEPWPTFATAETERLAKRHGLGAASARHLVERYGRRAADVAGYLGERADLAEPVLDGQPDLRVEFVYQRAHEMAVRPADFLLRRTRLGLVQPRLLETPRQAGLSA